ncbi:hypothetical protein K491DRAFT_324965 [Lophiostoma macrostomum CBS 122681]|uniref:Uncharacterized protein n=1 Tax=Lophiostoma macrostomum CBS 122681 TaxID=1314788 RepID=A0A6A6TCP3_9PLEO|nr:hypothetical protein K491DRAFT_324965 [Lophiostoma macrostomum CBS 122681]
MTAARHGCSCIARLHVALRIIAALARGPPRELFDAPPCSPLYRRQEKRKAFRDKQSRVQDGLGFAASQDPQDLGAPVQHSAAHCRSSRLPVSIGRRK